MGPLFYVVLVPLLVVIGYGLYRAYLAFQRALEAENARQEEARVAWAKRLEVVQADLREAAAADAERYEAPEAPAARGTHRLAGLEEHQLGRRIADRKLDAFDHKIKEGRIGGRVLHKLRSLREDGHYRERPALVPETQGWGRLEELSPLQRAFVLSEVVGTPRCRAFPSRARPL